MGIALLGVLLALQGVDAFLAALAAAPLPLAVVSLCRVVPLWLLAFGWQLLLPPPVRVRQRLVLRLRWIGESVNALLPVAQVGGDVVRARLLTMAGVPAAVASAALIVDIAAGTLSQLSFLGVGLAFAARNGAGAVLGGTVLAGAAVLVLATMVLIVVFRSGARRLVRTRAWGFAHRLGAELGDVDAALREILRRHGDLATSVLAHLGAWVAQACETYLVLSLIGVPIDLTRAIALESIASVARSAAFVIPGGLGVQEGVLVYVGHALGVPTEAALTLGVVKRLRELVVGAPALIVWTVSERQWLARVARRLVPREQGGSDDGSARV